MVVIDHLLNIVVAVKRDTRVSNGQGGWTTNSQTVTGLGAVRARRSPASTRNRDVAGQQDVIASHIFVMAAGLDVRVGDTIVLGTKEYGVLGLLYPSITDFLEVQTTETQHG